MIALPALLMCSAAGCTRRVHVFLALCFDGHLAMPREQIPEGWHHDPIPEPIGETRCPGHAPNDKAVTP